MENEAKIKDRIKDLSYERRKNFTARFITHVGQTSDPVRRETALEVLSLVSFGRTKKKEVGIFLGKVYQAAVDKRSQEEESAEKDAGLAALQRAGNILAPYLIFQREEKRSENSQDPPSPKKTDKKNEVGNKSLAVAERRRRVLALAQQGLSPKEITERTEINYGTVRSDIKILRNLGVLESSSKAEKGTLKWYHPILTREQEQMLFQKLTEGKGIDSLTKDPEFLSSIAEKDKAKWAKVLLTTKTLTEVIVACNQRFIISEAAIFNKTILGSKVTQIELEQAGKVGLLKAIDRFDPEKGTKFITHAFSWVVRAMQKETSSQIGITLTTYAAVNKALQLSYGFYQIYGKRPTPEELTDLLCYHSDLNWISEYVIDNAVAYMQRSTMRSLFEKVADESSTELIDTIPDHTTVTERERVEYEEEMAALYTAIDTRLTPAEQNIARIFFNLNDDDSQPEVTLGEKERELLEQALSKLRESPELEKQKKERVGAKREIPTATPKEKEPQELTYEWNSLQYQMDVIQRIVSDHGEKMTRGETRLLRRAVAKNEQAEAVAEWLKNNNRSNFQRNAKGRTQSPAILEPKILASQDRLLSQVILLKENKWRIPSELIEKREERTKKFFSQILLLRARGWKKQEVALLLNELPSLIEHMTDDHRDKVGVSPRDSYGLIRHAIETGLIHPDAVLYGIPLEKLDLLNQKERGIFDSLGNNKTREEITADLSISIHTLHSHISSIHKKLETKGRSQLETIAFAFQKRQEVTTPIPPEQEQVLAASPDTQRLDPNEIKAELVDIITTSPGSSRKEIQETFRKVGSFRIYTLLNELTSEGRIQRQKIKAKYIYFPPSSENSSSPDILPSSGVVFESKASPGT